MQKFRNVLSRWNGGDQSMMEAGELLGMSESQFRRYRDRLPKELALAGIVDIEAAYRFVAQTYLPAHNARFARPAAVQDSAFVAADPAALAEILCLQEERVVARDNTVAFARLRACCGVSIRNTQVVVARSREEKSGILRKATAFGRSQPEDSKPSRQSDTDSPSYTPETALFGTLFI